MGIPIRTSDFWSGPQEAGMYLSAVLGNPKRDDEGPFAYIARISEIVKADKSAGDMLRDRAREATERYLGEHE